MKTRAMMTIGGLLLGLAACGNSVDTNDGGAGGTGGTGGTGGNIGGGGTGGGGECAGYADEVGPGTVKVVFRNNTTQPIYLPGMCSEVDYQIKPSVADGSSYVYETSCLQTCEELQTSPQYLCGACQSLTYRVEAGSTLETTWDGTRLQQDLAMPEGCWFDQGFPSSCNQILAASPGQYKVDVLGYSECQGECACDAESGACVGGSVGGLMAYPNPASFSFPSANTVEVLFDTCAFGCPE